jgi:HSP20 family protein
MIRADLPGLKREDVTIDITDSDVCIQGERTHEREEEREGYYRSDRGYGSFCRVIPLPEGAMSDQAKASFKDGWVHDLLRKCEPQARRGSRSHRRSRGWRCAGRAVSRWRGER